MEVCLQQCLLNSSVALQLVSQTSNSLGLSQETTTIVLGAIAAVGAVGGVLLKYPRFQQWLGAVNTAKVAQLNSIESKVEVVAKASAPK